MGNSASSTGSSAVFEYFDGTVFTTIGVTENTDAMQMTGTIVFAIPGDWATNDVNGTVKFWFRITRTKNVLSTVPIENLVQYSSSVIFQWDEDGDVSINQLTSSAGIITDTIREKTEIAGVTFPNITFHSNVLAGIKLSSGDLFIRSTTNVTKGDIELDGIRIKNDTISGVLGDMFLKIILGNLFFSYIAYMA